MPLKIAPQALLVTQPEIILGMLEIEAKEA